MVECESLKIHGVLWAVGRFNRYMVECELHRLGVPFFTLCSFNRYMVECECTKMKKERRLD